MNADLAGRRRQASELLADRFTRVMNASTSPYGQLCDISMSALFSALPLVLIVRQAAGGDLFSTTSLVVLLIGLVPILVSVGAGLSLRGAREVVIDWLAAQPFPIEGLNSLLAGVSDEFEIHFPAGTVLPPREALQRLLDPISDDTLAAQVDEERLFAAIKIGVIDSPRFPLRSHFERYERFKRIVEQVIVPLHGKSPITVLRVVLAVARWLLGSTWVARARAARPRAPRGCVFSTW